ncbi:MAG TPA: hypothetical protein VJ715_02300 [Pyrinomonadaceae bacterium]|nr:hypothetical protein [Pyrinomonadaceae bacterium]
MLNSVKNLFKLTFVAALFVMTAAVASAQINTSGTVTMSGTVSKFVELNSGGAVTLSGNSGGGVTTDGVADSALAVVVNMGELGPGNTNSFVTASVPLKMRSNANYVLSLSAVVSSTGSSTEKIGAADIGFGIGSFSRSSATGVHTTGTDTNATLGDPTLPANGAVNGTSGRFEYAAGKSNLGAFSSSSSVLSGARILNAVPRANTNGLTVPAIFSVKPQFYENGTTTATATFTIAAP